MTLPQTKKIKDNLQMVIGAMILIASFSTYFLFSAFASYWSDLRLRTLVLLEMIVVVNVLLAFISSYGMYKRKTWGRSFAIIFAIIFIFYNLFILKGLYSIEYLGVKMPPEILFHLALTALSLLLSIAGIYYLSTRGVRKYFNPNLKFSKEIEVKDYNIDKSTGVYIKKKEDIKEPVEDNELAPISHRLFAFLLEFLFVGTIFLITFFFLSERPFLLLPIFWVLMLLYLALQIVLISRRSQTIGKFLMNIQVTQKWKKKRCGLLRYLFLREIIGKTLIIGALPLVEYLFRPVYFVIDSLFIFGEDRRTIHDLIGGTEVKKLKPEHKRRGLFDFKKLSITL